MAKSASVATATENQYKQSIEKLLTGILTTAKTAELLNDEGINFDTINKENIVATIKKYKDMFGFPVMVSGMIDGIFSILTAGTKGGKNVELNIEDLKNLLVEFFTENSHLIEGLDEYLETIKTQLENRK